MSIHYLSLLGRAECGLKGDDLTFDRDRVDCPACLSELAPCVVCGAGHLGRCQATEPDTCPHGCSPEL